MRVASAAIFLLLGLSGCVGTPQPDPPNITPSIDPDGLFAGPTNFGGVTVRGEPGTVEPPEAILRFWNLDLAAPAEDVLPDEDGSFLAEIEGAAGDELRIQAILEDQRSIPLDVLAVDERTIVPAPRPHADCLTLAGGLTVERAAAGPFEIEIRNACGRDATVDEVRLRLDPSAFAIDGAPSVVPAGGTAAVALSWSGPGDAEDVLILEMTVDAPTRRAVTLVGRGAD